MSKVSIIGAYNTKFGVHTKKNRETGEITELKTWYELLVEAANGALTDAGISAEQVDAVWTGACSPSLFVNQEHVGPLAMEAAPEALRFKPMTRSEGACASGSLAVLDALYSIEAGRNKVVLVLGVEKMSLLDTAGVTHTLACSSYWPEEGAKGMTFPGLFAEYAKGYSARHGIASDRLSRMLATIAAQMYRNGVENPLAHFSKGGPSDKLQLFSADAILNLPDEKNPLIAAPLRLHDCSLISDGAAGLVLAAEDCKLGRPEKRVRIAGIGHTTERMSITARDNMYEHSAGKVAAAKAFDEAGISSADIDIAEVHDCFTINQLISVETLGLVADGKGGDAYLDGRFGQDDTVCVNLSGGLKAKGHPVGATGVSMHALSYLQLCDQPVGLAPAGKKPETAVVFNVGGSAATNVVTVLQR
ncbi:MAG: propanoyl-CoA acyltransferase [Spirochaetes bacterium]|nr:propanoyl-CoA acyltransferase [Spirochaetota bacterium]